MAFVAQLIRKFISEVGTLQSSQALLKDFIFLFSWNNFMLASKKALIWHQAVKPVLMLIGTYCESETPSVTVGRLSSSVCKFDEWKSKDGGESLACKLVLK